MEDQTMKTNYEQLINNFEALNLHTMAENISSCIDAITTKKSPVVEALLSLTEQEIKTQNNNAALACIKVANFPFIKTFEDFDFEFQPSIDKESILDFASLRFLTNKENIIFIGPPGVGKTHLSVSIGIEVAKHRNLVYFISCHELLIRLTKAYTEQKLEKYIKNLNKYKLLIIDEVGYLPLDTHAANLLFQLVTRRYEKSSIIFTTNKPLSEWGEVFGDSVIANAILDRILHHSYVVNISGKSYRLKNMIVDNDSNSIQKYNLLRF